MGVKGLQYYVEQNCPEACSVVSVEFLASKHGKIHNCKPVLVVDGMSILQKLYARNLEWIYAGQWYQFLAVLKDFVRKFHNIGVQLVFFFDGTVCTHKRREWVSRRIKKCADVESVFRYIKQNQQQPDEKFFQLPAAMGTLTRFALKYVCDAEVYTTIREADQEIADYARRYKNVFAVLSQDSDFMIYNTKFYLSAAHLDLNAMTTVLYDRDVLATNLSLHIAQLPLFSCLMGNDVIPADELRRFRQKLCENSSYRDPPIHQVVPCICELIRQKQWVGNYYDDRELANISETVFGDCGMMERLKEALETYCLAGNNQTTAMFSKFEKMTETRHICCVNSPVIFNLLQNLEYDSSELLEDYTDKSLPPASLIFRPVRQRTYGLLFDGSNVVVREWCAYANNPMKRPDMVKPLLIEIPGSNIPTLEELWLDDSDLQDVKVRCFLACFGIPISTEQFRGIPVRYIVLCCILNYFLNYNPPLLVPWEVTAFISQAVSPRARNLGHLAEVQVPRIETRGMHLASLFMRGVATVNMVLSACGHPFPIVETMPWNYFDGKLFHQLYVYAKDGTRVEDLCDRKGKAIDDFYKLLPIVTHGSPLRSSTLFQAGQRN